MAKIGRPTKYRPEFANQARKFCRLGATNQDLADFFEVTIPTIWRWANEHRPFFNALKVGKAEADERVMRSLFHKAVGYSYDSEKIMQVDGKVERVPVREHLPPSDTAAIFWLKNRRPDQWRDKHEITQQNTIEVIHRVIVRPDGSKELIDGGQVEVLEDDSGSPRCSSED